MAVEKELEKRPAREKKVPLLAALKQLNGKRSAVISKCLLLCHNCEFLKKGVFMNRACQKGGVIRVVNHRPL